MAEYSWRRFVIKSSILYHMKLSNFKITSKFFQLTCITWTYLIQVCKMNFHFWIKDYGKNALISSEASALTDLMGNKLMQQFGSSSWKLPMAGAAGLPEPGTGAWALKALGPWSLGRLGGHLTSSLLQHKSVAQYTSPRALKQDGWVAEAEGQQPQVSLMWLW